MAQRIVITGASRGIGLAVAQALVAAGHHVFLLCRDPGRGRAACTQVATAGPGSATLVEGALDSVRTLREAAARIEAACPHIDVLIHNAGIWPSRCVRNEDGLEQAFVVNHLAPFLLNHLLEPRLREARARVVQVSAGLYVRGRPDLAKTPTGEDFGALSTYPTTKLCNLLLLAPWAARFQPYGVTINALHPGVIRTALGERSGLLGLVLRLVKRTWKAPEQGARPVVRLALDPALSGVTGRYFDVERDSELAPLARDAALAAALFAQACALTGLQPEEHAAPRSDDARTR